MIYVSTACIKKEKISDILQIYLDAGIQNIELSGGTSYYPEIEEDLKKYGEIYGLNYACHSYFPPPKQDFVVNLASCNDEIYERSLAHYEKCIELLKQIKCKTLSIHAGFYVEVTPQNIGKKLSRDIIYNKDKAMKRFCNAYKIINVLCEDNGIKLYLENNVLSQGNYLQFGNKNLLMLTDFESYIELKQQLEFELLLDLGHLHVSANVLKKNYKEEIMKFASFVQWIHMSENNGAWDQHRPLYKNGKILGIYQECFDNKIPVTLETNGSMENILDSISLLRGEYSE